jgi:hypothetical protein
MVTGAEVAWARADPPHAIARAVAEMVKAESFMLISLFAFSGRLAVEGP